MNRRVLVLLVAIGLLGIGFTSTRSKRPDPWAKKARIESPARMSALQAAPNTVPGWPPVEGEKFPELALYDHEGRPFSIEQLKGKPVLIELVAMTCAGCQAFSGGNKRGGFGGLPAQSDLESIDEYFKRFAGHDLFSEKLSFVQLIIYDVRLGPPAPNDLARWRAHFQLDNANSYVVSGGAALASGESFKMIPGFILLDKDLTVLMTATGHAPRHNLYRELLPLAGRMLK